MKKYELAVIGGGFAGVAAALAASRHGVRTILVEKSGCLGGAATNCSVYPFMKNRTVIDGTTVNFSQGIFSEIEKLLKDYCHNLNDAYLRYLLDQLIINSGTDVLFHSAVVNVNRSDSGIRSVLIATRSGIRELSADYWIDASGDAALSYMAGCPFTLGRVEDNLCQPMTMCFRVANADVEGFMRDRPALTRLYREKQKSGEIKNPRENILVFKYCVNNVLHFNTTRVIKLNPTDPFDLSKAEIIGREQVIEIFNFMKANTESMKNADIISVAPEIGIRESRMIKGEYILTGDDLVSCRVFEDAIACGNYDIDIHSPDGGGTSHYYFPEGKFYTIPYRSLVPTGVDNMLVAGRCISCDHTAQASIRIMPIVCTLGEAAGTAVAQAKEQGISRVSDVDLNALKSKLTKAGAFLG